MAPLYTCNMTDIQAALGLAQLKRYDRILERRQELIHRYDTAFAGKALEVFSHHEGENHSNGHLYLTRLPGKSRKECNAIIAALAEQGVVTNVHYKPLPLLTAYRKMGFDIADYPNAYAQFENEITLPLYTCLTDEEQEYVIRLFSKYC